jgi:hypothetical protein
MPSPKGLPTWFRDIPGDLVPRKIVLVRAGQTIFRQGDECNRVYYINHGIVKLSTLSPQGKTVVVGILGPGDLVGDLPPVFGPVITKLPGFLAPLQRSK